MTENASPAQEESVFRAVLHPHRSLGPKGFMVLMLAIGSVSFVTGMVFLMMGAWPVFGFFGLDVLLVYIAFKLNYRSGRAYEIVDLSPSALTVTRVAPSGKRESHEFNPYWVRVKVSERRDGQTFLKLHSHGREFEFGRCLNDSERRDFARALDNALSAARSFSTA
jgi:uncharacterized membrane protein